MHLLFFYEKLRNLFFSFSKNATYNILQISESADMKKSISVFYRIGRFEKLNLSVHIGIGRYEKKLIGRTLMIAIFSDFIPHYAEITNAGHIAYTY